ncbi:MAG: hypothetical protein KAR87_05580, partial [Candidatus Aenigmarchaeota archaeon]|nr:hypothetical protein [Candidatus Aenigmarchaeota archaeon]
QLAAGLFIGFSSVENTVFFYGFEWFAVKFALMEYNGFFFLRLRLFSAVLQKLRAENNHENRWAYKLYRAFQG